MQQNEAIVYLGRIRRNAAKLAARAGGAKFCAVVKADAYGHGAAEVARALAGRADMFAVALADEGMRLRLSCGADILVLVPPLSFEEAARGIFAGLIFSVGDGEDAALLARAAKRLGRRARCHLQVNTGMNRFGFDRKGLLAFCGAEEASLSVEGIYSHFYRPQDAAVTAEQFSKFQEACALAEGAFGPLVKHIAATGGLLADGRYALDMVRPGIGLYGYLPEGFAGGPTLEKGMRIYACAAACRAYRGGGAGYGGYTAEEGSPLSVVRCGYADGFFRSGGIGNVNDLCMDACLYPQKLKKYGRVCVLSDAEEYARAHGTIAYEVLVHAGRRAVKIYAG